MIKQRLLSFSVLYCLLESPVLYAHTDDSLLSITHDNFFILISTLLIIGAVIAIYLYRYYRQLKIREEALNKQYDTSSSPSSDKNPLYQEIAQHEATEALLKQTQDYLQSMINSMPSILIGVNRKGTITHWNKAAQRETNTPHKEALGKYLFDMIQIQDLNLKVIETAIDKNQPQRREAIQDGHGNHARYRDITVYPLYTTDNDSAVIRIDDITSRIHLENMIIQNEKMGSLGELAAGVAHEINNPLSSILQGVQNIQRRLSDTLPENTTLAQELGTDLQTINNYLEERKIRTFIESIRESGERAANIVTNMLEFSRSHTSRSHINLVDLLDRSIDLSLSSTSALKKTETNMSIIRDFPDDPPLIYGSATEIQQVLLNLLSNASHAFWEAEAIEEMLEITISLTFSEQQAIIIIKDNGPGMDPWTQRHIFDPFFTTKEVGKGTGLGLSVSYFIIVEHHKGSIDVESEPGNGTQFTITLPRSL